MMPAPTRQTRLKLVAWSRWFAGARDRRGRVIVPSSAHWNARARPVSPNRAVHGLVVRGSEREAAVIRENERLESAYERQRAEERKAAEEREAVALRESERLESEHAALCRPPSGRGAPAVFPMAWPDYDEPEESRRWRYNGPSHQGRDWPFEQPTASYSNDQDETGYGLDPAILAEAERYAPPDYEYPAMGQWIWGYRRRLAALRRKKDDDDE